MNNVQNCGWRSRCIGKFPGSHCCSCLGERRWEGRPRSHFHKPILHRSPHDTALWTRVAFSTLCFILSAIDGRLEQRVCMKFCVKVGKSTTGTLEMLREAFGGHSCQGQSNVSCGWWTFRATKRQQNDRKCWEHPWRPPSNPWACRHHWDQLWSLPDLNMRCVAPSLQYAHPHIPENHAVCE
jgi:hypothetical protein